MKKNKIIFPFLLVTSMAFGFATNLLVESRETTVTHAADHIHDGLTFQKWVSTTYLPTSAGNYYLAYNVSLLDTWTCSNTVKICLNGKSITQGNANKSVIKIANGGNLSIYDCNGTDSLYKYKIDSTGLANINNDYTDYNGVITGGYISRTDGAAAITMTGNSTLNFYAGNIIGNKGPTGAGIYAKYEANYNKVINITGGTIMGNLATTEYAAIMADNNCEVHLGGDLEITDNTCSGSTVNNSGMYFGYKTYLSGNVVIKRNKHKNGTPSNLKASGSKSEVIVEGAFGNNAEIHVAQGDNGIKNFTVKDFYLHNPSSPSAGQVFKGDAGVLVFGHSGDSAVYQQKYYLIFEPNGGSEDTQTVATSLPNPLPDCTKDGYVFNGWYYDEEFENPAVAGATLTGDTTLYAKWSLDSAIQNVVDKINEIGEVTYSSESKEKIDAASTAYNGLSSSQKALVSNYETLTNAISTYNNLEIQGANAVKTLIDEIDETITLESEAKINAAKTAYDALSEAQKVIVGDEYHGKLTQAISALNVLKANVVKGLITDIGKVQYTETCRGKIQTARSAYNDLNEAQAELVDNYTALTKAEEIFLHLDEVKALVDAIGDEVTTSSGNAIKEAQNAINALSSEEKEILMDSDTGRDFNEKYAEYQKLTQNKNSSNLGLILGIVGGVLALFVGGWALMMFVFNKWVKGKDKAVRAFPFFGLKKNGKLVVLVFPCLFALKGENEIFKKKEDAIK